MNTAHILGRISRIEFKEISRGENTIQVAEFSVACPRNFSTDKTDFIPCVAYENTAKYMEKYMQKGQRIYIVGNIQIDTWDKNGEKCYKTYIRATEVQNADKLENSNAANASIPNVDSDDSLPFEE